VILVPRRFKRFFPNRRPKFLEVIREGARLAPVTFAQRE
jgi:hypothetical protein